MCRVLVAAGHTPLTSAEARRCGGRSGTRRGVPERPPFRFPESDDANRPVFVSRNLWMRLWIMWITGGEIYTGRFARGVRHGIIDGRNKPGVHPGDRLPGLPADPGDMAGSSIVTSSEIPSVPVQDLPAEFDAAPSAGAGSGAYVSVRDPARCPRSRRRWRRPRHKSNIRWSTPARSPKN